MDPEVRAYFIRIINTLSVGLLWFIVNATAGIKYDLAFIHDKIRTANIIFYIWFVISLGLLLWYFYKIWSKPLNIKP